MVIWIATVIFLVTHRHSFKNRTGERTGEAIGLGFYRSDHWFIGSVSGFLRYNDIFVIINAAINK
jgi:hypothetical protein